MTKKVTGRSSWLEDNRADSIRRAKVCTERRADSNCKELTRSINRADSKTSEPTRTTHTDKITASLISLLQIQIFKRLDFKSQRFESWKTIIKAVKAPLEEDIRKKRKKEKKRELEEKGFCPISIKYPKRAKENSKEHFISKSKSKGLLETQKKIIKSSRSKLQRLLQGVKAATKLDN